MKENVLIVNQDDWWKFSSQVLLEGTDILWMGTQHYLNDAVYLVWTLLEPITEGDRSFSLNRSRQTRRFLYLNNPIASTQNNLFPDNSRRVRKVRRRLWKRRSQFIRMRLQAGDGLQQEDIQLVLAGEERIGGSMKGSAGRWLQTGS